MTLQYLSGNRITGLSSDTKPTTVQDKSVFYQTNDGKTFDFDLSSTTWTERSSGGVVNLGTMIQEHDSDIANYTTTLGSISGSSQYPITVSSFTNDDMVDGANSANWNLTDLFLYNNHTTQSWNLKANGDAVYVTKMVYKIRTYSWGSWVVQLQDANGNVADSVTISGDSGSWGANGRTFTRDNINGMVSKLVVTRTGGYHLVFGQYFTSPFVITGSTIQPLSNIIDGNTSTYMKTNPETNPTLSIDLGSGNDAIITQVALYPHTDLDETEIQIQTSSDNITYTTKRTVTVSNLTTSAWNLIRINATNCRYIRVRGSSGTSKTLAFYEIKLKNPSESSLGANHGHSVLDTTDTSLGLDGE
jgi:hypothetical protein